MKKSSKLGLKKVTLRDLDDSSMAHVAGGTLTGGANTCYGTCWEYTCVTCAYTCICTITGCNGDTCTCDSCGC